MTPLEEKIDRFVENLFSAMKISKVTLDWIKRDIQDIATQAVEERNKELLDGLPKEKVLPEEWPNIVYQTEEALKLIRDTEFNDCLSQVKSLINKSN